MVKKNISKTILCIIATLISINAMSTDMTTSRPRLAVIITVDGLQSEHLPVYMRSFEEGGFKRLMREGAYTSYGQCSYMPSGKCSDYASLMSGTTPNSHGMVGDYFYSTIDDDVIFALDDARYDGINSNRNLSPKNLQTTTIADEIKLSDPRSKVYAIGLDAESAMIMGGHLADCALWIEEETGYIATSSYYDAGLPDWAAKMNNNKEIEKNIDMPWIPKYNLTTYKFPAKTQRNAFEQKPVFYQANKNNTISEQVREMKRTPNVNSIIKELAIRALRDEKMGEDNIPDLLCVEFNARHKYTEDGLCAETEDMYMRLDEEINNLLDAINISVGMDNVVIVLTSTHTEQNSQRQLSSSRINSGTFNAKRSMALLNSYLMAIYGQGRWVNGYYSKNIHLNKSLIEDSGIKIEEIETYAAQLMMEFSGVSTTYTESKIGYISGTKNDIATKLRNSHFKSRSGDVVFTLMPGWFEVDEDGNTIGVSSKIQHYVPICITGYEIEPQEIEMYYEDIIPTLCKILQIPLPNGVTGEIKMLN